MDWTRILLRSKVCNKSHFLVAMTRTSALLTACNGQKSLMMEDIAYIDSDSGDDGSELSLLALAAPLAQP